jgi:hypothetical protein
MIDLALLSGLHCDEVQLNSFFFVCHVLLFFSANAAKSQFSFLSCVFQPGYRVSTRPYKISSKTL